MPDTAVTASACASLVAPALTPLKNTLKLEKPATAVTLLIALSVGASFTALTTSTKEVLALAAPSLTVTVMRFVPACCAVGTSVSVRLAPLPSNKRFAPATNPALVEVPLTTRADRGVSKSPIVKATVTGVPSVVVWLGMLEIVGASFTGLTVKRNVVEAVAPFPSVTVTVMLAVPNWSANGERDTVRLAPLPPKARLLLGSNVGLDEVAESVRLAAGVSKSPTVKAIPAAAVSSLIV